MLCFLLLLSQNSLLGDHSHKLKSRKDIRRAFSEAEGLWGRLAQTWAEYETELRRHVEHEEGKKYCG